MTTTIFLTISRHIKLTRFLEVGFSNAKYNFERSFFKRYIDEDQSDNRKIKQVMIADHNKNNDEINSSKKQIIEKREGISKASSRQNKSLLTINKDKNKNNIGAYFSISLPFSACPAASAGFSILLTFFSFFWFSCFFLFLDFLQLVLALLFFLPFPIFLHSPVFLLPVLPLPRVFLQLFGLSFLFLFILCCFLLIIAILLLSLFLQGK